MAGTGPGTVLLGRAPERVDLPPAPELPSERYDERVDRARASMREQGLDVLVVAAPEDVFYLTGLSHQGHFALTLLLLSHDHAPVLVARAMEAGTIGAQTPQVRHAAYPDDEGPGAVVTGSVAGLAGAGGRVGVPKDSMSLPVSLFEHLVATLPGNALVDASGLVEELRAAPDDTEVASARRAGAITARAVAAATDAVRPGARVRDVAATVSAELVAAGSEYPGFAPLVRTRDQLLHEHVALSERTLEEQDTVFLEVSAAVHRYHAPMTRMVHAGDPPPGTDESAAICRDGLEAVRAALVPGTPAGEVYAAWQRVVDRALGHGDYRRHHCGYLVGIGFPPSWVGGTSVRGLRPGAMWPVREGMTFHVLSWLVGRGPPDHALSDTALVTSHGGELLTTTPDSTGQNPRLA